MAKVIEAIDEKGVFKPLEKVELKEGEKVRIRNERRGIYDVIVDSPLPKNLVKGIKKRVKF